MSPPAFPCLARTRGVSLFFAMLLWAAVLGATSKKPPVHPVNINSATAGQLQQVPGIGPATAGKILQMRKSYGAFKSVDDLLAIRGIGPKRLEKMRKYLVAGKAGATPAGRAPSANATLPAKCPGCAKAASPSPAAKSSAPAKAVAPKPADRESQAASEDEEPE